MNGAATQVVIGLSAVVMTLRGGEASVLTVPASDGSGLGLPFGRFDPEAHRTFELALRAFVTEQTGFELGYVEQLYTFGDKGRDAPLANLQQRGDEGGDRTLKSRIVSVGYLALTPAAAAHHADTAGWAPWSRFFPWEDWRSGRPPLIDEVVGPALAEWAAGSESREARARLLFARDGAPWNDERVLERYELLYEAGLVVEAARDRGAVAHPIADRLGRPMISDHRRILATAFGRLRGKLRYRPVIFELTPPEFTLLALQRAVEAVAGVPLHKPNFRRAVERTGLVEGLGRFDLGAGGRPAELFRFRREALGARPVGGLPLPSPREEG
jgi:hypothetical protein